MVNQNFLYVKPANYFVEFFAIVIKKLFTSKLFTRDVIFYDRDSIEGKLVTAVDELKGLDCGNKACYHLFSYPDQAKIVVWTYQRLKGNKSQALLLWVS